MPRMSFHWTLLAGLALATMLSAQSSPLPQGAAAPAPAPDSADAGHSLQYGEDNYERMTVPVEIGGQGPYPFVVDTGAERTVISRELAHELRLAPSGQAQLHSMTGSSAVDTVMIPVLGISAGSVRNIRAPALARSDLGATGLLGIDSLRNNQLLLDFRQQTMTIRPASAKRERLDPDEIVVTAKSKFGQLILADAEANGHRIAVIIDTGSQISIGNSALRRKILGKKPRTPPPQVEVISVTGGRLIADYTRIDKIKIGGVTMTDMPIAFVDAHPFAKFGLTNKPALMLGMNGLKAFDRVAVDFANRKVRFLLPTGADRDHDMMLAALRKSGH